MRQSIDVGKSGPEIYSDLIKSLSAAAPIGRKEHRLPAKKKKKTNVTDNHIATISDVYDPIGQLAAINQDSHLDGFTGYRQQDRSSSANEDRTDINSAAKMLHLLFSPDDTNTAPESPVFSEPHNVFYGYAGGLRYIASEEVMKQIENEIYSSMRVEPIALSQPKCKDEVRLRYRLKDCLWLPLIGTRHMKTYSTTKYGFAQAWALARAVAHYISISGKLPASYPYPTVPLWTEEVTDELEHYVRTRLSGVHGTFENPGPIPLLKPKRQKMRRGRYPKTDCADQIIMQSYQLESESLQVIEQKKSRRSRKQLSQQQQEQVDVPDYLDQADVNGGYGDHHPEHDDPILLLNMMSAEMNSNNFFDNILDS